MLDQLDLVHMNGRVYDPFAGRFMSADPLISDPTNGQGYNRYAYVLNNPTNLIDPTGFSETMTGSYIGGHSTDAQCYGNCDFGANDGGNDRKDGEGKSGTASDRKQTETKARSAIKNAIVEVESKCSPAPCAYHYGYDNKLKANVTAIVREDGTVELRTGNIPWRDNNPGDIRDYGSFGRGNGAIGTDTVNPSDKHGFLVFPDKVSGEAAMGKLLNSYGEKGLDLAGAISKWAPPSENDTAAYQAAVAKAVGVTQDTKLKDFTAEQKQKLMQAIMVKEGYFNTGTVTEGRVKEK